MKEDKTVPVFSVVPTAEITQNEIKEVAGHLPSRPGNPAFLRGKLNLECIRLDRSTEQYFAPELYGTV